MATFYRLEEYQRPARGRPNLTFFDRHELNLLLSLYSRRVMSGEWRDYAIDQRAGMAVFSVFRHTLDNPIYAIAKRARGPGRSREYLVYSGKARVKRAETLSEALSVFDSRLRVVSWAGSRRC